MQDILNRLRAEKEDEGFTLIELLVVVVIIGVLVAIAVPVYLNYRQGAADKSAQSDVRGAISAIEQYFTDNGNKFPADLAAVTATTKSGWCEGPVADISRYSGRPSPRASACIRTWATRSMALK